MKHKFTAIFLLLTAILSANSIFSFYGMANQYYGNDAYSNSLGDAAINDLFRINTSYANPSVLASSNKVIFSTAGTFGYQNYKDAQENSFRDDGFYLPYFTAAFPILNHRFGLKFSLLNSGNLKTYNPGSFISEDGEEFIYEEKNSIIANIYELDLAYALKTRFVNFGISGNYYIGHKIKYWEFDFDNSTVIDTEYERRDLFKDPGFTMGLSSRWKKLSVGATYSSAVKLDGSSKFIYAHEPFEEDLNSDDYIMEIPAKISAGLSLKFAETFKIHTAAYYQLWADTDSYDTNTTKFSAGISYDPLSGYGKWYESVPLRVGFSTRQLPFEVNNSKINEMTGTFGFSVPLSSPNKRIDFSVEYLKRGDTDDNGLSEDSLMFTIGVTGFDIFSKKPRKIGHRDIPEAEF